MRCRLSRPCIRWLKYTVILGIVVLVLTHGLVSLSRGRTTVYSLEFDTGLALDGDEEAVNLGDDYDTVKEPMRDVFAKIDEQLKLENSVLYNSPEESNEQDIGKNGMLQNRDADGVLHEQFIESRRTVKTTHLSFIKEDEKDLSQALTILINSYGVNKSTVIDNLFKMRTGVMIFKEPSLTLRPLWYFRGDNQLCSMKDASCMLAGEDTSGWVNHCLSGLARCSLDALVKCIGPSRTIIHTESMRYKTCKRNAVTDKAMSRCHLLLRNMCKAAKVKVIQARNLALDIPMRAQKYIDNFMVVHVFRDARHVVYNEKMSSPVYLKEEGDVFYKRITSLCNRTKYDLITIDENQNIYRNNDLYKITNEELLIDTKTSLDKISAIFNKTLPDGSTVYDVIKEDAFDTISKQVNSENAWKQNMDENAVSLAFDICADVYKKLSYKLV